MSVSHTLNQECIQHLEAALDNPEPSEKDFHIRQALQTYRFDDD